MRDAFHVVFRRAVSAHMMELGYGRGESFVQKVRDLYEEVTPPMQRLAGWSERKVPSARFNADYQYFKRQVDSPKAYELQLLDPVLYAISEEARRAVLSDLVERHGYRLSSAAGDSSINASEAFANLMHGQGKATSITARLLADNEIDENDCEADLRLAQKELGELIAAAQAMLAKVNAALPKADVRPIKRKAS